MVGHTALGIIVGADLCAAVAGAYHGLTLGCDTVEILLMLQIVESRTEFFESAVFVLELRALLLALDHQSGRNMGKTDSRIGGVDALSARA